MTTPHQQSEQPAGPGAGTPKQHVPNNYRLAEEIFAKVVQWGVDKLRIHPTDIYQIIQRFPNPELTAALHRITALEKERDEAKDFKASWLKEYAAQKCVISTLTAERDVAIRERDELRRQLRKYGFHLSSCPQAKIFSGQPCNCGFDQSPLDQIGKHE